MMKRQMVEIGYDASRLPLGKLSRNHITKVTNSATVTICTFGLFTSDTIRYYRTISYAVSIVYFVSTAVHSAALRSAPVS